MSLFSFNLAILRPKNFYNHIIYKRWYNFINKSQWWSKEQLTNYQWIKLKKLLKYAYKNVPYYKKLFKSLGANPSDIRTFKDFSNIPFLTKEIIRDRHDDFLPENFNKRKARFFTTGGSTGEPLGFYKGYDSNIYEKAFMFNQWARVGFQDSSKRVILRGEVVPDGNLFKKIKHSNSWILSSYQLSENNIKTYIDFLNKIKPDFFHVYPSSMNLFTHLLKNSNLFLDFEPKAILCGSEILPEYQRKLFENTFNTRVYSWLGLAEQTTLAGECEYSTDLHIWPQHSYVELTDEKSNKVNQIGESGEIIGTNLHNYVTPFIRYKSGDIATYGGEKCNKCKRNFKIFKNLKGRKQDYVYSNDGSLFPINPVIFGIHSSILSEIKNIQIIQEQIGKIIVKIDSYNDRINTVFEDLLKKRLNGKISFKIISSNDFFRTKNGKHIFLIQKLNK